MPMLEAELRRLEKYSTLLYDVSEMRDRALVMSREAMDVRMHLECLRRRADINLLQVEVPEVELPGLNRVREIHGEGTCRRRRAGVAQ